MKHEGTTNQTKPTRPPRAKPDDIDSINVNDQTTTRVLMTEAPAHSPFPSPRRSPTAGMREGATAWVKALCSQVRSAEAQEPPPPA